MLTVFRMSVDDCLIEYEHLCGQVFGHPRLVNQKGGLGVFVNKNKYSTTIYENAIKDIVRRRGEAAYHQEDEMPFRTPKGLCKA